MDIISFNEAATANGRIEKFIKDPDSNSGIVTVPKVIGAGESVTIPAGRIAVLPNVRVDGTLNVEGEVFIPSGSTFGDLEDQLATKADTTYVNGKYSGFKNYIINGNFDIWQRGNGPFTSYYYGADRWIIWHPTATMSSSSTSLNGIQKRIAHIQNVTAGGGFLGQAIELPLVGFGHPFVVGKKFTLSVRYGSSTKIRPSLIFMDSTAGLNPVNLDSSMASPVYKGGSGVDETVSWTFTVDGTAASTNTCLVLILESESNASDVYVYQVQLEEGSVATPFEQRPYGLELSLCQRYYEVFRYQMLGNPTGAGQYFSCPIIYNVAKRTVPTLISTPEYSTLATSYTVYINQPNGGSLYVISAGAGILDYRGFVSASAEL